MLELMWLQKFVAATDDAAEDIFTKHLRPHVCRFLSRFLRNYFVNEDDRQEVVGMVLTKLWVSRDRIEIRSIGAWWRYVGRIAHNCALDELGGPGKYEQTNHDGDEAFTDEFWDSLDVDRLYRAADEVWLGVPKSEPAALRDRKLFIAKLYYKDGVLAENVGEYLPHDRQVSIGELHGWLQETSVLDRLTHTTMHRRNDELTVAALGLTQDQKASDLDRLASDAQRRAGEPPAGWTWEEVCVIFFRYRNGLSEKKIAQLMGVTEDFVGQTLDKARNNIPIGGECDRLHKTFGRLGVKRKSMAESGVWKRTAFQYDIQNEYPQKSIVELMEPLCDLGPFKFNAGILNVWISGERLLKQLRDYIEKESKGE